MRAEKHLLRWCSMKQKRERGKEIEKKSKRLFACGPDLEAWSEPDRRRRSAGEKRR